MVKKSMKRIWWFNMLQKRWFRNDKIV